MLQAGQHTLHNFLCILGILNLVVYQAVQDEHLGWQAAGKGSKPKTVDTGTANTIAVGVKPKVRKEQVQCNTGARGKQCWVSSTNQQWLVEL
jgi:hypothetical protein